MTSTRGQTGSGVSGANGGGRQRTAPQKQQLDVFNWTLQCTLGLVNPDYVVVAESLPVRRALCPPVGEAPGT